MNKHYSLVLFALFLLAAALAQVTKPAAPEATGSVAKSVPLYVPSPPLDVRVPCGTWQRVADIMYWPTQYEHTYTAEFLGTGGGHVEFTVEGETARHDIGPLPPFRPYELAVTPTNNYPGPWFMNVVVVGPDCSASPMVRLRGLNIHVAP